jgi:microcystin-dependent protein
MADPFVAEIRIFPFNFAPRGWAFCDGQILSISQNTALFSLLGTVYGGNGASTFALPDLQGRTPLHPGQGAGLSLRDQGETAGTDFVTLLQTEIPIHSHAPQCFNGPGDNTTKLTTPVANTWTNASFQRGGIALYHEPNTNSQMNLNALGITGSSLPHNNLQPYLVLNFCIALQGVFPPRT